MEKQTTKKKGENKKGRGNVYEIADQFLTCLTILYILCSFKKKNLDELQSETEIMPMSTILIYIKINIICTKCTM